MLPEMVGEALDNLGAFGLLDRSGIRPDQDGLICLRKDASIQLVKCKVTNPSVQAGVKKYTYSLLAIDVPFSIRQGNRDGKILDTR
jgi:hypothetical protein